MRRWKNKRLWLDNRTLELVAWSSVQFLKNDRIQIETVGKMAGVVWEGRPLAMRESVTWRLSFWIVVPVDPSSPQANGFSWGVEGACVSGANITSE